MTKLQSVLALTPDEVAAIPSPLVRIRALEQESEILPSDVQKLRRQLDMRSTPLRPDLPSDSFETTEKHRSADRGTKRRRTSDASALYVVGILTYLLLAVNAHGGPRNPPRRPANIPGRVRYIPQARTPTHHDRAARGSTSPTV